MAEPIDVAFVEIRPDTRGFGAETRRQIQRELRSARANVGVGGSATAAGMRGADKDAARLTDGLRGLNRQSALTSAGLGLLGGKASRVGVGLGLGLAGGAIGAALAVGAVAKAAISFEDSFAGVRKTVDATDAELDALAVKFLDLSTVIPISTRELNAIGEAAGALGVETDAIIGFVDTVARLGVTTDLASDVAADALARIANITQLPQAQFENLGSTIVDLGNRTAATESEIVEFGLRIAGAGQTIGLTVPEILGFGAALASVGLGAEAGGTAISSTFVRIAAAVEKGGPKLKAFADVAGTTSEAFASAFKDDPATAIVQFIEGLGRVRAEGGSTFATLDKLGLGGIRVRDALLRASGAGDLLVESLRVGNEAFKENTALQRESEVKFGTTASGLRLLGNEVNALAADLGAGLLPGIDAASRGLAKGVGGLRSVFKAIGGSSFDIANADLEELTRHLAGLDKFQGDVPFKLDIDFGDTEEQLRKITDALKALPVAAGVPQLVAAFTAASPRIAAAMDDGVITPMEKAALATTHLGQAFLDALPPSVFAGLGEGVGRGIRAAEPEAEAAIVDLGRVIRSGIQDVGVTASEQANQSGRDIVEAMAAGMRAARQSVKEGFGRDAGFARALDLASAAGDRGRELELLRRRAANLQGIIDKAGPDAKDAQLAASAQAGAQLSSVNAQIRAIEAEIAGERQNAADDAKRAADDERRDAEERVREARQNRLTIAETNVQLARLTEDTLRDDKAAFRHLIRVLIERLKATRIASAAGRQALLALRQARQDLADVFAEERQDRLDAQEDLLRDRLTLAGFTEDKSDDEKALRDQIAFYKRRSRDQKLTAAERRKYLIQLRQAQKDLKDLRAEEKATGDEARKAAASAQFEFLQTQQGFAANLLGNLIPGGATGGLLSAAEAQAAGGATREPRDTGNVADGRRTPQATLTEAQASGDSRKGITQGQANQLIALTRQMLGALTEIKGGAAHPEAATAKARGIHSLGAV